MYDNMLLRGSCSTMVPLSDILAKHISHITDDIETKIENAKYNKIIHLCEHCFKEAFAKENIAHKIAHQITLQI